MVRGEAVNEHGFTKPCLWLKLVATGRLGGSVGWTDSLVLKELLKNPAQCIKVTCLPTFENLER